MLRLQPDTWTFNVWKLGATAPPELIPVPVYLFARMRLPRFFPISEASFLGFVDAVCASMSLHSANTPYHNFWHAVDVMQVISLFDFANEEVINCTLNRPLWQC